MARYVSFHDSVFLAGASLLFIVEPSRSSSVNSTSTALRFSSRWSRLLLLGMGMMSGPWAMSHANSNWVVVMPLSLATWST